MVFNMLAIIFIAVTFILLLAKHSRLTQSLYTDALTHLPNRIAMEKSIYSLKNYDNTFIVFIDISNFQWIYESTPHENIDLIIKEFSDSLKSLLTPYSQKLGRIDKTKFCILTKNLYLNQVLELTDYIYSELSKKNILLGDYIFNLNVTIGISHIKEAKNPSISFSLAEMALIRARKNGNNKVVYLSPSDLDKNINEIYKMNKISSSIKYSLYEDKLILYLQPILNIKNNTISHYEGLVRIIDENGSFLSPGGFIHVAEKYSLISQIDKWVFNRAISFLKEQNNIKIFINLSAVTLNDTEILKYFEDELIKLRLNRIPINLGIEITETATIENLGLVQKWMNIFKSLGCVIALDDFGVGYTSLSYLESLPIDFVKIDGCFIKDIVTNKGHESIVHAIKMVSETFNKKTICEFVENEDILDKLNKLNIDYAQGYHIGRPFPSLDLNKKLYKSEKATN